VLGRNVDPLARQVKDDAAIDDESGHDGVTLLHVTPPRWHLPDVPLTLE
jgi:hypothetical protein